MTKSHRTSSNQSCDQPFLCRMPVCHNRVFVGILSDDVVSKSNKSIYQWKSICELRLYLSCCKVAIKCAESVVCETYPLFLLRISFPHRNQNEKLAEQKFRTKKSFQVSQIAASIMVSRECSRANLNLGEIFYLLGVNCINSEGLSRTSKLTLVKWSQWCFNAKRAFLRTPKRWFGISAESQFAWGCQH